MAVKKSIHHFRLYLKPIKFLVRTYLKIMLGMINLNKDLADNNARMLRWVAWLDSYDFDIKPKPGYLDFLADLLTREAPYLERKDALWSHVI